MANIPIGYDPDTESDTDGSSPPPVPSIPKSTPSTSLPLPPPPPIPLKSTSMALNINSSLHRKQVLQAKQMPLRVETCLMGLEGLCLACLVEGIECRNHKTPQCFKWSRIKMGRQAFDWKKEYFCSSGDKGYCYRCLLNPDYAPVHPNGPGYRECIYDGIVFELCWIMIGNKELLGSLGRYLDEPGLTSQSEFIDWLRGKFDDDRKWRNCATLLLVWFYNTFRSPQKPV